jgi:ribulose-5-phosphate 4-epimerase/fuculose-1-phosphate aldolase
VRLDAQEAVRTVAEVGEAARVLARLGLVTAYGHVSARIPGRMVITPAADLAEVVTSDLVDVPLDVDVLPADAPREAWAHLAVYAARPDVAAVARAQPLPAYAVASLVPELPVLYGQAAWLGGSVPVHDDARLLRSADLARAAALRLGTADALLLRGNGALTCGATPGDAVARMWLLANACTVWLAASASGTPRPLDAGEVDAWRSVHSGLLPRLWRHLRTTNPGGDTR